MLMNEREQTFTSMTSLDLKPLYPAENCKETLSNRICGFSIPKVRGRRRNIQQHVVRFLDSMRAHSSDWDFCLREFSKSLIDHTQGMRFKPGSVHDLEYLVSFCTTLSFSMMKLLYIGRITKKFDIWERI